MMTDIDIKAPVIRFKGIMDFDELYKYVRGWLTSKNYLVQEDSYKDKGKEFEIKWSAVKDVTEYYQYKISIKFLGWDMSKIEIIDEKTKLKQTLDKGRIEITIKGELIEDYNDNWKGILKEKLHVLYRIITKGTREEIQATYIYGNVYGLYNAIKGFLDMSTQ